MGFPKWEFEFRNFGKNYAQEAQLPRRYRELAVITPFKVMQGQ